MPRRADWGIVPIPWTQAEPARFAAEHDAMAEVAPELVWDEDQSHWEGPVPVWPFSRGRPGGLDEYLRGERLTARVDYAEGFPMVAPRIVPLDPEPDPLHRSLHEWHVNPNGTLCLLQAAADWDGTGTAADLVVKASGWYLEYRLMTDGRIDSMTEHGIVNDDVFDHLLTP